MLSALSSADGATWVSILVKALAYAATLVAAGSVLVSMGLRELTGAGRRSLCRMAVFAALAAAVLSVMRVSMRASFLMGGSFKGAFDPTMLGIVVESPLGASVIVRLIGLALILTILLPVRGVNWVALSGAVVACLSFALRGHALGDPRFLLGVLVTVHILGLAFWIGALAPLARTTRAESSAQAASLAHEFGTKALWVVAALIVAGGAMLTLFGAATPAALATPYGQAFVIKLALFAGVLALAALNKLRLTPDLLAADPDSGRRLRRSIGWESALIAAILVTTAALTTVTSPPTEQAHLAPQQEWTASIVLPVSGDFAWRL